MNLRNWKIAKIQLVSIAAAVAPACVCFGDLHLPATLTQQVYEVWDQDIYVDATTGSTPTHSRLLPLKLIAHNGRVIVSSSINAGGMSGVDGMNGYKNSLSDFQNPTSGAAGSKAYDILIISDAQSITGIPRARGVEITHDQNWNGGDGGQPGSSYDGQHLASNWCAESWDASNGVFGGTAGRGGFLTIQSHGPVLLGASIQANGGTGGSGGDAGQGFWPDCSNGIPRAGKGGGIAGRVTIQLYDGADVSVLGAAITLRGGSGGLGGDAANGNGTLPGGQGARGGDGGTGGLVTITGISPGTDVLISDSTFYLDGGHAGGGGHGGEGNGDSVTSVVCPDSSQCVEYAATSGGQGGHSGDGGDAGSLTVSVGTEDIVEFDGVCEVFANGGGFTEFAGVPGGSRVDGGSSCSGGPNCPVGITSVGLPADPSVAGSGGDVSVTGGTMTISGFLSCVLAGSGGAPGVDGVTGSFACCNGTVFAHNGGQGQQGGAGGAGGKLTINCLPLFDDFDLGRVVCGGCGGDGGRGGPYLGFGGNPGSSGADGQYLLNGVPQATGSCPTCNPQAGDQDNQQPNC